MSDKGAAHDAETTAALRRGLEALPLPEPSPDFDLRVLQAVSRPPAAISGILRALGSVLLSGVLSALICYVLVEGLPTSIAPSALSEPPSSIGLAASLDFRTLDAWLDRPDLRRLTPAFILTPNASARTRGSTPSSAGPHGMRNTRRRRLFVHLGADPRPLSGPMPCFWLVA